MKHHDLTSDRSRENEGNEKLKTGPKNKKITEKVKKVGGCTALWYTLRVNLYSFFIYNSKNVKYEERINDCLP